jgi:hypothetical protein
MNKQIRNAAIVAAVGAAFAGSAQAATILGAGASAVKNSVQLLILKDYCAAGTINFFDNGTATVAAGKQPGGSIFRIQCTQTTLSQFGAAVDIGYDTTGGSWKAFTAVNTAMYSSAASQNTALNANPVSTVATTGCTLQSGAVIAVVGYTFTVNYNYGCAVQPLNPATQPVNFGLTDVEPSLFLASADNQPLVNGSWAYTSTGTTQIFGGAVSTAFAAGTEASGFPKPVFGVVFGVAASPTLYSALQADQIASGLIPSTCTAGTVSATPQTCAPFITRAQYASIVANSAGALNSSVYPLFSNTALAGNGTFELARRDQGSGTQASSNAYFLNDGCSNATSGEAPVSPLTPFTAVSNNITYNATTGGVITEIGAPTLTAALGSPNFAIGVISVENESSLNTAGSGKGGVGSGFLRLDGFYPSVANATMGRYSYVSEENLHANPTNTGDALQFVTDLTATSGPKVTESAYNYGSTTQPAAGIVQINSAVNTTAPWGNGAALCSGWQHL